MAPSNIDRLLVSQNQRMRLILCVPRVTSGKMMRHELQMLPVEHRTKLMRAKLYWKIRGNIKHPLHTTINRRQRNGWTTEIQECHRLSVLDCMPSVKSKNGLKQDTFFVMNSMTISTKLSCMNGNIVIIVGDFNIDWLNTNGSERNKLSEHIRTSNFDCFRKSVKTMLFTQQYGC